MIDLPAATRRISGTRLLDLCQARGITSLVDPFMGLPMHLNVLKRHGITAHGGDLLRRPRSGRGPSLRGGIVPRERVPRKVQAITGGSAGSSR